MIRKIILNSISTFAIAELTNIREKYTTALLAGKFKRQIAFECVHADVVSTHLDIPPKDTSAAQMPAPGSCNLCLPRLVGDWSKFYAET